MIRSTLSDTDILEGTTREPDEKGRVRLVFPLSTGKKVTSEYVNPDELKGKVILKWAELVRQEDTAELLAAQEDSARLKEARRTEQGERWSAPSEEAATADVDTSELRSTLPRDPFELAKQSVSELEEKIERLEWEKESLSNDLAEARRQLDGWKKIQNGFSDFIVERVDLGEV